MGLKDSDVIRVPAYKGRVEIKGQVKRPGIFEINGTAENFNSFGLKEGGMGVLAQGDDVASSQCVIADHPEIITLVKAAAAKIISGELVIPDPLAG